MAQQFQVGDVVQLKSGGPKMTVDEVKQWNGVLKAFCSWFDEQHKREASWPVESLKTATSV